MSINKFNSEGYYDPTAYEAMTTVEKEEKALRAFRPIVYICSPYAGDVSKNVENARNYSRFAVDKGYIPVAPHLLFPQFLNDNNAKERQLGLFFGNAIMSYLVDHYSVIYEIDYRYWEGDLAEFARQVGADDVIFVNNLGAIRDSNRIGEMDFLVPKES